jgi:pSer/pThr/pTyr-binding forkhead associated (FHA) protein
VLALGTESTEHEASESAEPDVGAHDEAVIERLQTGTALLVVRRGPASGARFLLDADLTTAGRHPDSDIFLDDITVSRHHAEFTRDGVNFQLRDLGSLNGTYVNRSRIDETTLVSGDEVQIGKYRLLYLARSQHGDEGGDAQPGAQA